MPFSALPRWTVLLIDIVIALFAVVMAYWLRFSFDIPLHEKKLMYIAIVVFTSTRLVYFTIFQTFSSLVQYTSIEDVRRIVKAVGFGTLTMGVLNLALYVFIAKHLMPYSVVIIEFLVTTLGMLAWRMFVKTISIQAYNAEKVQKRVLILGGYRDGMVVKRALERDSKIHYTVVAYLEEITTAQGQTLESVPVFGIGELTRLLHDEAIDEVIIASILSPPCKQQVIEACLAAPVQVRSVPPMTQWINGELSARQIREVRIEELLERNPIQLDLDLLANQIAGKTVLVTGAAGSIGSEIARQLVRFNPKKLVLLDQAETPLYELDLELGEHLHFRRHEVVIGDIRNKERIRRVFEAFRPQVVYHAAAYKHVPMMENNPSEAVLTNILGTQNLVDWSIQYEVETFVFVSTDKAVNPTNIMGASKRVAEMYVAANDAQAEAKGVKTRFITTRFGNVLGSNGSVIPLFKRQIAQGGPVTVTHPEMTRYFMTIPEACQLVLEAGVMGKGGEIFVFDMGDSVKVLDLAKNMIQLSGLELGKDIQIVFTGLRPGEKLYEELLAKEEVTQPTHHPKILIAKVRTNDRTFVAQNIAQLKILFDKQDNTALVQLLKKMVPEYKSNNSEYERLDEM